jgi:aconitate hydratase
VELELCEGLPPAGAEPKAGCALLLQTLDEVRQAARRVAHDVAVKAVIAPFVPSGLVGLFAGAGILALSADATTLRSLKGQKTLTIAPVTSSTDGAIAVVTPNRARVELAWLAVGAERAWTLSGTSRPSPAALRQRST